MTLWKGRRRYDPAAGLGDLEAALHNEGCPVCARTAGADERWLDRFLDDGYLDHDVMHRIAASGGFCAFHAGRMAAIGHSATVALIYLSLIDHCLPRLAARRDRRSGAAAPFSAPIDCAACAHQREVERRECFFLALLIQVRGLRCYGAPALVCIRHLPPLLAYLGEHDVSGILALHLDAANMLRPESAADTVLRLLLGQPPRLPIPPAPPADPNNASIPDPIRRMRCRLCNLPSCAVCAELSDARVEWLVWLAGNATNGGKMSDVLPLCREHVWQARSVAGPALAPTLAGNVLQEVKQRLVYAADTAAIYGGSRRLLDRIGHAFGAAPARRAALASLSRRRECPLCARLRETGERALALVAALVESIDGRGAFESGYGLCIRHAARAIVEVPTLSEIAANTAYARLTLLRWELEEQLRRGAWQARPQRRGVESAAWLRAGPRFAGVV
jgi:hypothetical protein